MSVVCSCSSGPDFEPVDDELHDDDDGHSEEMGDRPSTSTRPPKRRQNPIKSKPKTEQQLAGENLIDKIWLSGVAGAPYSFR